ncbi:hypothetical protein D3C71_1078850 [compost metagenome]
MNPVIARAAVYHVTRAHLQEGVVACTAFEAVGEAEPGDDLVVSFGVALRRVIEHVGAVGCRIGIGTGTVARFIPIQSEGPGHIRHGLRRHIAHRVDDDRRGIEVGGGAAADLEVVHGGDDIPSILGLECHTADLPAHGCRKVVVIGSRPARDRDNVDHTALHVIDRHGRRG